MELPSLNLSIWKVSLVKPSPLRVLLSVRDITVPLNVDGECHGHCHKLNKYRPEFTPFSSSFKTTTVSHLVLNELIKVLRGKDKQRKAD